MTRKQEKRMKSKNNSHAPKYMGPAKLVSYCPECPPAKGMVTIDDKARTASCPAGHVWQIRH